MELVTAGVARIPGAGSMPLFFVLTDAGLVAILLYDVITRGRPHAATVWGGLFLIAIAVHPNDRRRHREHGSRSRACWRSS